MFVCFVAEPMHIFKEAKRHPPYDHWEPIYIGTNDVPIYDERLTWEGKYDKMTQVKMVLGQFGIMRLKITINSVNEKLPS